MKNTIGILNSAWHRYLPVHNIYRTWPLLLVAVSLQCIAEAQAVQQRPIKIREAVALGEARYHQLKSVQYEADAASKGIDVAKYSRLPTVEASYQAGQATANNLTGMFYPGVILPISGPPSTHNVYSPAAESAAGLLLNWQATTFGQRNAQINIAVADAKSKKSAFNNETFRHKINILSTYLDVLLAQDVLQIHQHNIERVSTSLSQSRILANTGIKPGVDTALFLSELSKAKIDYLNAQNQLETKQWMLAALIVTDSLPVPTDTGFLNHLPLNTLNNDSSFATHPLMQYAQSQYDLSRSKELYIKKSYMPKLSLWGTGFARGSGFQPDGSVKTWDGLGLTRYNYGAGLQLSFSILKYGEVKQQLQQQELVTKAAQETLQQNQETLTIQQRIANTTFINSVAVATESQQQLVSGKYAFSAMQLRYNTGLVDFSDLIQSQYNLLKAELDVKKACWEVWKSLLLQAAVKGDELIFLNEIR